LLPQAAQLPHLAILPFTPSQVAGLLRFSAAAVWWNTLSLLVAVAVDRHPLVKQGRVAVVLADM